MSQPPGPSRASEKDHTKTCLLVGCAVFAVSALALVGLVALGGYATLKTANQLIEGYTSDVPAIFPEVKLDEGTFSLLEERVRAFGAAIDNGEATEPLVLTADELNALFRELGPDGPWANALHFAIDGDRIACSFSFPIGEFLQIPSTEGRYLNGTGTIQVVSDSGYPEAHIVEAEVNGSPIPEWMAADLRDNNLFDIMLEDPEAREALRGIRNVAIVDGAIVVTPANQTEAP